MTDWNQIAQALKLHMKSKEPEVKVRDVQALFELSSTSRAEFYISELVQRGVLRRVDNGGKSLYFINWGKK